MSHEMNYVGTHNVLVVGTVEELDQEVRFDLTPVDAQGGTVTSQGALLHHT